MSILTLDSIGGTYAIDELERQAKWDYRFLTLTREVATWSKDPSTKCGSIIVRPDLSIASLGFNGFPKGTSDADELYANRDEKYARVVHAELNAILQANEPLKGYTIYTYQIPNIGPSCDRCSAHIIQAGISRIVFAADEPPERWRESIERGFQLYREAGVAVVSYDPIDFNVYLEDRV